jgi:superfamily I DNA and/or RNA helicase
MPYIEDLSYQNIVNIIQSSVVKAADVLNSIARENEKNDAVIKKLQHDLDACKMRKEELIQGANRVLKHMDKTAPLAVIRNGYIVVVTDLGCSIERNVL